MPLISSGGLLKVTPPPAWHWGEPKGRVRHIAINPDGLSAIYMIEEEPAQIDYKIELKATRKSWSHKIWVPWRYFFINVRYDTRVESGNMGYLYFARERLRDLDSPGLCRAVLPNVFSYGGICLGYTNTVFDRTPVRSAWRAVRDFYSIPGNQWLSDFFPRGLYNGSQEIEHYEHRLEGKIDYGCKWSTLSKEEVMALPWELVSITPRGVLFGGMDWKYQKHKELSPEIVNILFAEREVKT